MLRRWFPTAVLVLLAIASSWWLRSMKTADNSAGPGFLSGPDLFMEDFVTTVMDPSGKPKYRLEAKSVQQFTAKGTREFEKPYLVMYQAARPPWHIRSEHGTASGTDEVLLTGDVHVWRNAVRGEDIDLQTQRLRILPNTEYGETDAPVVIRTQTAEAHGTGMQIHLREQRLVLLAKVRTQIVSQNAKNQR